MIRRTGRSQNVLFVAGTVCLIALVLIGLQIRRTDNGAEPATISKSQTSIQNNQTVDTVPTVSPSKANTTPSPAPTAKPPLYLDFGKLKAGESVPDFEVQDADGKLVRFSDYVAGKTVVCGIWGVSTPAPMIEKWESLWKKYQGEGVVFVGIVGSASREDFDQWREKLVGKISFPLAFDPVGRFTKAAKTRDEMTPDELKVETERQKEFYGRMVSMRVGGVMAMMPSTLIVNTEHKLVGWVLGFNPTTHAECLSNALLRAGVKLAEDDMPAKIYTDEELRAKLKPDETSVALLRVGTAAPDFTSMDIDWNPVKISDYRGKVVVLDFWATWCGPCIASMPHTQEVAASYKNQGVIVLGCCTSDDRAAFESWVNANRQKYPDFIFTHDPKERSPERASSKLYGVNGIPQQFIIDREGKIAALNTGYMKGEVLLDAALAHAGVEVEPSILEKAKMDQAKRSGNVIAAEQ